MSEKIDEMYEELYRQAIGVGQSPDDKSYLTYQEAKQAHDLARYAASAAYSAAYLAYRKVIGKERTEEGERE